MKIAVMGAGGVGGYFGGMLANAGEDVTFIARGAHLEPQHCHDADVRPLRSWETQSQPESIC